MWRTGRRLAVLLAPLTLLLGSASARGDNPRSRIVEEQSIARVLEFCKAFGPDTVIFDLDDTLWHPKHMIGTQAWFNSVEKDLVRRLGGDKDAAYAQALTMWDAVHQHSRMRPVERATVPTFRRLMRSGKRVIALTAQSQGVIEPVLGRLRALGLEFPAQPTVGPGTRVDLGQGVSYQDGVIFSQSPEKKLYALNEFHRRFGASTGILFIDDSRKNLELLVHGLSTPVLGVQYTGAEVLNRSYDPRLADRQWRVFQRTGKIQSNTRARLGLWFDAARRSLAWPPQFTQSK
jgi:hypothetical protein